MPHYDVTIFETYHISTAIFETYVCHKDMWIVATNSYMYFFYPTAHKGCQGIVFTHGIWIGGRAGGRKKFVWAVSQKQ